MRLALLGLSEADMRALASSRPQDASVFMLDMSTLMVLEGMSCLPSSAPSLPLSRPLHGEMFARMQTMVEGAASVRSAHAKVQAAVMLKAQ